MQAVARVWRRRLTVAAALVVAASTPAHAGALGAVVDGLRRKSDNDDAKPAGGGGDDDVAAKVVEGFARALMGDWQWQRPPDPVTGVVVYVGPPPVHGAATTDVYVYLGVQSVDDSDGSLTLELRANYGDFGIALRDTSFFEDGGPTAADDLRLDLWSIGGQYRAHRTWRTQAWLEGGLGGVEQSTDLSLLGWYVGARGQRRLGGELAAEVGVRRYDLEDDITANEVTAALRASILRVSYRYVDFNVGPPLQGPEVGVALVF